MGSFLQLFPVVKGASIGNISIRRTSDDDIALGVACEKLLKHRRRHQVMIITKHGEIVFGIEKTKHIIQFYRQQKEIKSIHLIPEAVVQDAKGHLVPNISVA